MFTVYVNKWHIHIQWRTVQSKSMSITKNMWYFIKLINSFILFSATRLWRYCPKRSASSFKSGTSKDNTWWMDWNTAKEFSHPTMSDWVPRYSKTLQIKHSYHSIGSSKTYIMKRYENCTEITAQWPIYIRAPLHDSFRPERNDQSQAVFFWANVHLQNCHKVRIIVETRIHGHILPDRDVSQSPKIPWPWCD